MVKHVISKMVETNEEMARITSKHSLMEIEDRIAYIASKLVQYQTASYPYNTLLVLDDAAGSPLLKNGNSELCRLLTKTRHFNLTCIIAVQTLRFVHLNVKRLATDIIGYIVVSLKRISPQCYNRHLTISMQKQRQLNI